MASENLKFIIGIVVVLGGIVVILLGMGTATTTCLSASGGPAHCTTDQGAVVFSYGLTAVGVITAGAGGWTTWKNA